MGKDGLRSSVLLIAFLILISLVATTAKGEGKSPTSPGTLVMHPTKLFEGGKVRFFEYKVPGGPTVKYFVLKSPDGVIRAAFNACDVCWPEGKGYEQRGDFMVCRNCGQKFASTRVNEVKGGCNPAPLSREILADQVVLKVQDITRGGKYFDLSKRRKE
jgi:uncharacterized membrane protein